MKTSSINFCAGILLVMLTVVACNKKLEEYNPSGLTSGTVYTTPAGFESLVNAAYSYQRWWYGKEEGYSLSEMGTDTWTSGAGDVHRDLSTYVNLQGANTAIANEWKALYAAVNLCNAGINNVGKAGLANALSVQREAELRFLRAFYYWHIVETWGGVHFTLQETDGATTTANKTPVDTFYAQIFRDLQFAVNNLAAKTTEYGRVTKPAAMSFLARMYLTRQKYAEARDIAAAVIKDSTTYGLGLVTPYSALWQMSNEKNKEVVYAVNYSAALGLNDVYDATLNPLGHARGSNSGHMLFLMVYDQMPAGIIRDIANGRPFNRYMPTPYLLNLYADSIDARYEGSFQTVWKCNKAATPTATQPLGFRLGDTVGVASKYEIPGGANQWPRNKYFVYDRKSMFNADGTPLNNRFYVALSKFMDPTRSGHNEPQSARDVFVIRFAEVLLIAAEAEFQMGNAPKAAEYINIIRRRAAKPGKQADMEITAAKVTLDFILDERAREFAGEQIRWFDLKRTGKLLERAAANPNIGASIKSHHLVRPIPQSQLDAVTNKDTFKQNDEYQ